MKPLADDTTLEIEALQIERWRAMSPAQKLQIVAALSRGVRDLALAGIRQRHPNSTPREQFLRLAVLTLGRELAAAAYPEIDQLDIK